MSDTRRGDEGVSEADVSESERDDEAGAPTSLPTHDPEAPEADVLEQQAEPHPHGDSPPDVSRSDADEADLLEQAREADGDDEDERR